MVSAPISADGTSPAGAQATDPPQGQREDHVLQLWKYRPLPIWLHSPPYCTVCKVEVHATGMCPIANKPPELKCYGFSIEGAKIFAMDYPVPEARTWSDNSAVNLTQDPRASVELIESGMKKLIDENWNWQVTSVRDGEFAVIFPNGSNLKLCKNATGLTLPISKINVVVVDNVKEPAPVDDLKSIWIRLRGVPSQLRFEDKLLAALVMVGKPVQVDALSLINDEDVMARVFTPAPANLNTSIKLFINGEGFPIRIFPDLGRAGSSSNLPPPKPSNFTHGHVRSWAPDPNGQGMGRHFHPWVLPMGNPINRGQGMGTHVYPWATRWAARLLDMWGPW